MIKFAKNDRFNVLIILARDEQFYFPLENDPKEGPLDDFFAFSCWMNSTILLVFPLVLVSSLNMITPHFKCLFKYYVSHIKLTYQILILKINQLKSIL